MNYKLRLLVTTDCPRKCKLCCNNQFNFEELPVVKNFSQYNEINITGGEPLLFPEELTELLYTIKETSKYNGINQKIYLYTSVLPYKYIFFRILSLLDGICYTPHDLKSAQEFIEYEKIIRSLDKRPKSLRINIFPEVRNILENYIKDLPEWKVKEIDWVKDCPVPKGEDFKRIYSLWQL